MPEVDAPSDAALEKKKRLVRDLTILNLGQTVLQHVLQLQSEVALFTRATGGDQVPAARALATSTGLSGLLSLIVNQVAGKLSDCFGRRPFFALGPIVNLLCTAVLLRRSDSIPVLIATRITRQVVLTFSGSVMAGAVLADFFNQQEAALIGPLSQVAVGIAVILGPYIENRILQFNRGDPRSPFKANIPLCLIQLLISGLLLPETHPKEKRASFKKFLESVASINPFSFLKVYFGKNQTLKRLLTIQTLQTCSDGKVMSDLTQLWCRNGLGWGTNSIAAYASLWGATVTASSCFLHPYLLKKYCTYTYTTIGNLSVWFGITLQGLLKRGICVWCGLPVCAGGVNGGNAHAIKALTMKKAQAAGYDNGEWSAWANNMRAMVQSLAMIIIGRWYAMCNETGIYQGTAWAIGGFLAGGLPQVLMWATPREAFE